MAKEDVNVGIGLEIVDIDTSKFNAKEMEADLNKKLNGVRAIFNSIFEDAGDISKIADTKMQKQFVALEKKILTATNAMEKYNSAIAIGSEEKIKTTYRGALTSVRQAQIAMDEWEKSTKGTAIEYGILQKKLELAREEITRLRNLNEEIQQSTTLSTEPLEKLKADLDEINDKYLAQVDEINAMTVELREYANKVSIIQTLSESVGLKEDAVKAQRQVTATKGQVTKLQNKLDAVQKEYNKLSAKSNKTDADVFKTLELKDRINDLTSSLAAAQYKLKTMQQIMAMRTKLPMIENIDELSNKLDIAREKANQLKQELTPAQEKYDEAKYAQDTANELANTENEAQELQTQMRNIESEGSNVKYSFLTIRDAVKDVFIRMKDDIQTMAPAIPELIKEGASKINPALGVTAGVLLKILDIGKQIIVTGGKFALTLGKGLLKTISKGLGFIAKGLANILKHTTKLGKKGGRSNKKLLNTFLSLGLGVRSLLTLLRRMRTEIIKGMNTLAISFPEINSQISSMVQSFNQAKGSFISAFQPIASVVMPILTNLASVLSLATDKLAEFFAVLTGQGFIYKATAQWQDYADSVNGASKAQDKLASYDKLDVIQKDSQSSGGNVFENITFEPAQVTGAISEFAELVKQAWQNADFTEVGNVVASKFYEIFTQLANKSYDILGVLIPTLSNSIATLINGLTSDTSVASGIGTIVAKFGKLLISSINNFFTSTDWLSVGKFIGTAVNSILTDVKMGDWFLIITNKINALFNFLSGLLQSLNWAKIGTIIANSINKALKNTNIANIAQTISNAISSMFTLAINFLSTLDWAELGKKVRDFIANIDWANIFTQLGTILGELVSGLIEFIKGLFTGESGEISIGDTIAGLGKEIVKSFKGLMNGFIDGVNKVIATPFTGINNILSKIKNVDILGIKPFSNLIKTISAPKIPHLAQGGVIPPNKEFLAVLGDQKSGTNVEAPLSTIKQALSEVLQEKTGGSKKEMIVLQLDGKTIAQVVWDEEQKRYKQVGKQAYSF